MRTRVEKEMTEAQKNEFLSMCCQLSPENLHCDGEISRSQAQAKYNRIMKRWKALEKEVGMSVDTEEPFSW